MSTTMSTIIRSDDDGITTKTIKVADHAVVTSARKGDTLVMAMTVFGHMWTIRDFTVTLYYKR